MSIRCATFVLATLLASCQSGPRPLTDSDRVAIRALEDSFAKLAATGSFTTLVDLYYAEDAVLLAPNAPPAVGRGAIEATFRALPPLGSFSLKSLEIEGADDHAWSYHHYSMTLNVPGVTTPVPDEGHGLVIYQRQSSGSWKAIRDMFNSSLPAPGAGAEPRK